jgi:peroxiredoxin
VANALDVFSRFCTQKIDFMKYLVTAIIVLVLSVFSSYGQEDQHLIGSTAPPFTLKAMDGKTYSLEQMRGKYVVLHFAATWCPFCNAEAPNIETLYKDYRDKGVEVFIVDVKEDKTVVEKSLNRFSFSFPVLLDEKGVVSAAYAPEGVQPALARDEVPIASNLIIDKEGKIRFYSLLNTTNFDAKLVQLRQKLDELIAGSN